MDGLHKLIEMLEKRFGKRAADGLLLLSVLGAAAWGLRTFVVDFVLPVGTVVASLWKATASMKPISFPSSVEIITQIAVAAIAATAVTLAIRYALKSRARLEEAMQAVKDRLACIEFDRRTVEQERDALEYFIEHGGESPLRLPPKVPLDESVTLRPETREGRRSY